MENPQQSFPFYSYSENGTTSTGERHRLGFAGHFVLNTRTRPSASGTFSITFMRCCIIPTTVRHIRRTSNGNCLVSPSFSDFWSYVITGRRLGEIHVSYEDQPEYLLDSIEAPSKPLDWRVEKMKLSKDKTQIRYNDFLTLAGIPPEAFDYRLGNRSALNWVIDQYRVKTDKRSGITNDPNRPDDPKYIVKLIGKVITVSLETVKLVKGLPEWFADIK